MKKSYHSMVVPTVAAITARRSCVLCSESESLPRPSAVTMVLPPEVSSSSHDTPGTLVTEAPLFGRGQSSELQGDGARRTADRPESQPLVKHPGGIVLHHLEGEVLV